MSARGLLPGSLGAIARVALFAGVSLLLVFCNNSTQGENGTSDGGEIDLDDAGHFICPDLGVSKGPWAVALTETTIKIRWEACRTGTDPGVVITSPDGTTQTIASIETPFVVNNTYGAPLAQSAPKDWAGTYYMHEAALVNLAPSTCYTYVLSQDPDTNARFCTARKSGDPYRFLVIGDTNPTLGDNTTNVLGHVVPSSPDFTLHGGDIQYYDSTLETWAAWFPLMNPLLRVGAVQATIGNHESEKPDEYTQYTMRFFGGSGADEGDGYYRFESGGIWFFAINTEDPTDPASIQGQWLVQELAYAAKQPGFLASIVFFHKPFLTCGDTGDSTTAEDYYAPIFKQYKVPLVFQAHMHGYERFAKDGITWVTAGGGGGNIGDPSANVARAYCNLRAASGAYYNATIIDVSKDGFNGTTVDTTGAVRDSFAVAMPAQ